MDENSVTIEQENKVKQVYVSYLKWFLGAGMLAIIGTVGAYLLNTSYPLKDFK